MDKIFNDCNSDETAVGAPSLPASSSTMSASAINEIDMRSQMINNAVFSLDRQTSDTDGFSQEVSDYLSISKNAVAFSAQNATLSFWRDHASTLPRLSCIARVFLAIHAGSVPVECLFSTTGLILNSKRCSLSPDKVNMITFIHDNYDYL